MWDGAERATPLFCAAAAEDSRCLAALLAAGADLDLVDNEEHSAVHWAVVCGQATTYTHICCFQMRGYYILLHVLAHFLGVYHCY